VWVVDIGNLMIEALSYGTRCRRMTWFYLHTHVFIHERDEPWPATMVHPPGPKVDELFDRNQRANAVNHYATPSY